jgi:ribonuclease Z
MQFDAGRGTIKRLSQVGISPSQLNAIFLTHMHSDHTEGLAGLLQYRWHFLGDPVDIICSADVVATQPPPERTLSCRGLVVHSADAMLYSGEIAQRYAENKKRDPEGPSALARLQLVALPLPVKTGSVVWQFGDVVVTAIATAHIPGSLAYRVDTPAGSVVISGDAGNSTPVPPRETSTSEALEALAAGADVLVQSVIHPVFAPDAGSNFPAAVYLRQSSAGDIGSMAERIGVRHLMLTHLIPSLGTKSHGPFTIPGGGLNADDFESAVRAGGFKGKVYVGQDLLTLRLPMTD